MIKLERPKKPKDFENLRKITDARAKIRAMIDAGKVPVSDDFSAIWKDYKPDFLDAQHGGKCAFCETRFLAAYYGDVEHFRPKTSVKDVDDPGLRESGPPRRDRVRTWKTETQPGYWWLAYTWDNWLASCTICNSSWKGNQFPLLAGARGAMIGGAEASERPALLNPFDTDPWNHIAFFADGDIEGISDRGIETVQVVGLDRWRLVDERRRIAERLLDTMADYAEAVATNNEPLIRRVLRDIAACCADDANYAGMCRWLVDESPLLGGLRWTEIRDWVAKPP